MSNNIFSRLDKIFQFSEISIFESHSVYMKQKDFSTHAKQDLDIMEFELIDSETRIRIRK